MAPSKIMLIRHAEKPPKDGSSKGVGEAGGKDANALIVRGWQRAGALVRFFAPLRGRAAGDPIQKPDFIFAAAPDDNDPSLRPSHTVAPLAALLPVEVDLNFAVGQEAAVAEAMAQQHGVGLVCWEHHKIATLVETITQGAVKPPNWKGSRFDLVFVLDRGREGWSLTQVPQMLLAGDSEQPFALPKPASEDT